MEHEDTPSSFGRYLRDARLENRIGLEEISKKTKIKVENLLLIENEIHVRLPAPPFVKGLVKLYAEAAGADVNEASRLYKEALEQLETSRKRAVPFKLRKGRLFFILTVCLAMAASFSVYLNRVERQTQTEKRIPETEKNAPNEVDAEPVRKTDPGSGAETGEEKLRLKIIAIEETWLKVIIDGINSKAYTLKPGDRLELEALSDFNLLIGNAAGLRLTLNDKTMRVEGKSGQVVNLKIP